MKSIIGFLVVIALLLFSTLSWSDDPHGKIFYQPYTGSFDSPIRGSEIYWSSSAKSPVLGTFSERFSGTIDIRLAIEVVGESMDFMFVARSDGCYALISGSEFYTLCIDNMSVVKSPTKGDKIKFLLLGTGYFKFPNSNVEGGVVYIDGTGTLYKDSYGVNRILLKGVIGGSEGVDLIFKISNLNVLLQRSN